MNEKFPTPESQEKISREQVISAYKKFVERGITNPDKLDLDDPEVIEANKLSDKWMAQEDSASEKDDDYARSNFQKTMLYVDAGFTDPAYLGDVLGWLMQDSQNAEKDTSNPSRIQLRHDMAEAIIKIRNVEKQINLKI